MSLKNLIETDNFDGIINAISNGEDPNQTDRSGATALIRAVVNNRVDVIDFLLANGASPDQCDKRKWTPLHFAAQEKNITAMLKLIEAKANLNAINEHGNTILSVALSTRYGDFVSMAEILLKNGADHKIKNNYGIAPAEVDRDVLDKLLPKLFGNNNK